MWSTAYDSSSETQRGPYWKVLKDMGQSMLIIWPQAHLASLSSWKQNFSAGHNAERKKKNKTSFSHIINLFSIIQTSDVIILKHTCDCFSALWHCKKNDWWNHLLKRFTVKDTIVQDWLVNHFGGLGEAIDYRVSTRRGSLLHSQRT